MNKAHAKKIVLVNLAYWFVAMLLHPLIQSLPTGSDSPYKTKECVIPVHFVMPACSSNYLQQVAIGKWMNN